MSGLVTAEEYREMARVMTEMMHSLPGGATVVTNTPPPAETDTSTDEIGHAETQLFTENADRLG